MQFRIFINLCNIYIIYVKEAVYNGWKGNHGIKKQSAVLACGNDLDVTDNESCRRHDTHLLGTSNLNERLENLTAGDDPEFNAMLYGDSAYPNLSRICCSVGGVGSLLFDAGMNGVRESVEWSYKEIHENWTILKNKKNFKMLVENGWEKANNLMDLCWIFNNALNCMNHNQISQWFQCPPPSFESYTAAGPRVPVE